MARAGKAFQVDEEGTEGGWSSKGRKREEEEEEFRVRVSGRWAGMRGGSVGTAWCHIRRRCSRGW